MARRCSDCAFWMINEHYGGPALLKPTIDPDYVGGTCRRNAPRPTLGDFEFEVLQHLTTVSWAHADEDQKKNDFDLWEEAYIDRCSWPTTKAEDWCGEFQPRESNEPEPSESKP
jgi:hypothetical protein